QGGALVIHAIEQQGTGTVLDQRPTACQLAVQRKRMRGVGHVDMIEAALQREGPVGGAKTCAHDAQGATGQRDARSARTQLLILRDSKHATKNGGAARMFVITRQY